MYAAQHCIAILCTGSNGDGRPTILHYNTVANAVIRFFTTGEFRLGSLIGKIASIQEVTLPHEDSIASEAELQAEGAEVERAARPEELKRYSPEEAVRRARKRKDEEYYDLAKTNCESFAMWCPCDSNISLQSKPWVVSLYEIISGLVREGIKRLQQLPKEVTKFIDSSFARTALGKAICAEEDSFLGSIVAILTLVVETSDAGHRIYEAKRKWDDGTPIKTREEFTKEIADTLILLVSRFPSTIGGTFVGQIFSPVAVVGAAIGGKVGTLLGHVGEKELLKCSGYLASIVDKALSLAIPTK